MAKSPKIGLFPGTFDPITNGHLDIVLRAQALFDRLVVAIGHNPAKKEIFTVAERAAMIEALVRERCDDHVEVATYPGLTVDYAREINATAIIRGLRNVTDLNYEFQIALTNRALTQIETVFIMSGEQFAFTSSTLIKQIAAGGDIERLSPMIPHPILDRLKEKKIELGGDLPWAHVDHWKGE